MLKSISKLGKKMDRHQQKEIYGSGLQANRCPVGCNGLPHGSGCFGAPNCHCPGICSGNTCNIF